MLRASIVLSVLLCAAADAAQPAWITLQNENFRVYSTANERDTRAALNQFERVRGFFVQFAKIGSDQATPVSVVIFGSEKEYQPYRLNAFATAYYSSHSDRDFIVVGKLGAQSSQIASHEYTHLVYAHEGFDLPPWLNEGLAELFSTLRPAGEYTEFGAILPGRLQALNQESWVPLETIVSVDQKSPYYNEAKRAGSLYNQSWALVHMLTTTEQYRAKFWDVVTAVDRGMASKQALETVYGVPLATLESELKNYVRRSAFNQLRVKISLQGTEQLASRAADLFEVRAVQAELLMGLAGRQGEARAQLEALTREDATKPGPWSNLGYLAWREGQNSEAAAHFAKAFDLGSRSPRMLLDFARLAGPTLPERTVAALTALLESEPSHLDGRLLLADVHMSRQQYSDALATVRPIASVKTPIQRDHLLFLRAVASLSLGDVATARANAEELKKVSESEAVRARAEEILRIANRP